MWTKVNANTYDFHDEQFDVVLTRLNARDMKQCGYPQCRSGWSMRFRRGGCHAYAIHDNHAAAHSNAARIMNYCRGTHDVYGNPLKKTA